MHVHVPSGFFRKQLQASSRMNIVWIRISHSPARNQFVIMEVYNGGYFETTASIDLTFVFSLLYAYAYDWGWDMLEIRRATITDLPAITEIYNDAILKTVATFDTETKTVEDRKAWLEHHGAKYPVLVAVEDGIIKGWASLTPWSDRCAYSGTVENSVYVKADCRGNGIGKKLLEVLLDEGQKAGFHTVIARIAETNDISIHLHELFGFKVIGVMEEVGVKFDKLLDVYMMQKIYR